MLGHVSSENKTYHSFAEHFKLVSLETLQKVTFRLEKNRRCLRSMVVFLYALIVIANCSRRHSVNVVPVVEAIVVEVVANSCHKVRNDVHVVELGYLRQASRGQHIEAHLHHVSAVKVVVVLDILAVPLLNPVEEGRKLLLVVKMQLGQNLRYRVDHVQSQVLQTLVPSNFVAKLKDVEFPFV